MDLPSIGAVVPTLHRPDLLKRCVQALLQDPGLSQVHICIDGPDENSRRVADVLAESDPRVTRVQPGARQGRMQARQNGVEACGTDLVLLVDDDVIATSHLATNHALRHSHGPRRVVMGYMGIPAPTNVYERIYSREYESTFEKLLDSGDVLRHLWGGNISLARSDALEIGLVSPGFEDCYFEDRDFGLRCAAAGLTGVLAPEATADHHHHRNARRFVAEATAMGKGMRLVHERHPNELGTLPNDHFVTTAPRSARPLVRLLGHLPTSLCVAALETCSPSDRLLDASARLVRRAKQHAGPRA